ncbi:hypothetical protein R1sor_007101 [Riccia sorocarpa]|uniref:Uncharacterized protein n=1 Tax=Riccia sorocarpa TaxID=122646 RepID=A0ABD3HPG1_9MARC
MGENQPAPTFFLEATPKKWKRARKPVVDDATNEEYTSIELRETSVAKGTTSAQVEEKIGEVVTTLAAEWKDQAICAVTKLIKASPTPPPSLSYASFVQLRGLQDTNSKLKEIVRGQHDQLTVLVAKHTRLQVIFRELETKALVLETAYGMCAKAKEVNKFIFAQYVDTLKSKIEDVTRILELESLFH